MATQESLTVAFQHHQAGRLDEAARLYRDILAIRPDQADALHLLGVVAHQRGEHARAVDLMGRAVAIDPSPANYHANLGEAYRGLNQLDRAAECYRAALHIDPQHAEAANNLGLVLLAQERTPEAVMQFRAALHHKPDFAMACNNLGNALRTGGDPDAALAHFRRAVEIDPRLAEAQSNLGQLLLELYQPDEALAHCRAAVHLCPDLPEARNNLGNALREAGRLPEARQSYAEALRLNPALAMTYANMGQALQEEGALDDALAWYRRALQLDPNSARFACNLAGVLLARENHEDALSWFRHALEFDPSYAEAHSGVGAVRHEQGFFNEAETHFREALRQKPDLPVAHCALGTVREELGDFAEAESAFRAALRHDAHHAGARAALATLLRGKLPEPDLEALRRRLAETDLTESKRSALYFGLAQVLDARQQYDEAAASMAQANALASNEARRRGQAYDSTHHDRFVDAMISACTPAFCQRARGFGLDSERPVFILGLPRSGTTLTEQILACHSQCLGAGELSFARKDLEELAGPGAAETVEARSVQNLAHLDEPTARHVCQIHLTRLHELNDSALRVVDKMPDNYLYLGLLAALFPRARFIHCRRELRDVAVSCWMTNFRHIRWANDIDHIAGRFSAYQRLMEHWRHVLPVPVLEVNYEETVADLESVARRLVSWCGLEWEPACLNFHEGTRPVRTASVTQVRQAIYKRSVARWRHYETSLEPLFAKLPVRS